MGFWNTRGLRGSSFEDIINVTNDFYLQSNLAVIQKVPTPIKPVKIDKESRTITLAYFDQQSTVDYIGVVQGVPVCFDAKETERKSLPISHIHPHQIEFMKNFERQNGVSFILAHFKTYGRYFFLPFSVLNEFYENSKGSKGRKSIPFEAFDPKYEVFTKSYYIHYIEALKAFLEQH